MRPAEEAGDVVMAWRRVEGQVRGFDVHVTLVVTRKQRGQGGARQPRTPRNMNPLPSITQEPSSTRR